MEVTFPELVEALFMLWGVAGGMGVFSVVMDVMDNPKSLRLNDSVLKYVFLGGPFIWGMLVFGLIVMAPIGFLLQKTLDHYAKLRIIEQE